jgi:phosphate transport system substrate-binding protein
MSTTNRTGALARGLTALAVGALTTATAWAGNITIKGSDTILVLSQRWAEEYMKKNPGVTIQVTGGGSGTGIAALINGTTDLANASRKIKPDEKAAAAAAKREAVEIPVAMDALSIVVNASNPVHALSTIQVGKIFSGYINNWKQVGGPDHAIIRYTRESSSGTYAFIKDEVLKGRDYAPDCQTMPGTSAVAEAVARDPWGIGFGGVSYFAKAAGVRILDIKKTDDGQAVSPLGSDGRPNYQVVYDGSYALSRYLFVYSPGQPQADVKAYIDWVLGAEGQKIVEEVEYIPLPKK